MRIFDVQNGELVRRTIGAGGPGSGRPPGFGSGKQFEKEGSREALAASKKAFESGSPKDHKAAYDAHHEGMAQLSGEYSREGQAHIKQMYSHNDMANYHAKTSEKPQRYFSRRLNGPGSGAAESG